MSIKFENASAVTSPRTLSGALGLVVIPDHATIQRAYALAEEIMPRDAEYVLREGSLPHVTLYHGKLDRIPQETALETLQSLQSDLVGKKFILNEIVTFGGKLIFWNVDPLCAGIEMLREAHLKALSVASYLDRTSEAKALSEEGLSLRDEELENVRLFGHPLVRSLFTPHITLGFQPRISEVLANSLKCEWSFEVASVELVKIGYPGRVEGVVNLVE